MPVYLLCDRVHHLIIPSRSAGSNVLAFGNDSSIPGSLALYSASRVFMFSGKSFVLIDERFNIVGSCSVFKSMCSFLIGSYL